MIPSGEMPLDSALKLVMTRCRKTGCATARRSSKVTRPRPASVALALAPSNKNCTPRGPAPQLTPSRTNLGDSGSWGRVVLHYALRLVQHDGRSGNATY